MKLLLDQGLPRSSVQYLRDIGIFAEHVGELGRSTASDQEILDLAIERQSGAVVSVTTGRIRVRSLPIGGR